MVSERGLGVPKTEEERQATHEARFGSSEVPPRGTGQDDIAAIARVAESLDVSIRRLQSVQESYDLTADAGDNTVDGLRVKQGRLVIVTNMWAYDATSAPTYIRLGFWNRTRYVWVRIEPAPLVLETVEFHGMLVLSEGMWPAFQGNGITANDDLHGGLMGYWVRAPRIS